MTPPLTAAAARQNLLYAWMNAHPNQPMDSAREQVDGYIAILLAEAEQLGRDKALAEVRDAIAEKFDRHGMMSDPRGSWPHEYTNGYHGQQERRECRGCELAALIGIHDDYHRDRMLDVPPWSQARAALSEPS